MASAEEVAAMRLLFEQQQARFEEHHQAFVADQQTRAAQTQQLLENNNNLAARIDELLRLGQSEQDKRQELERELAEERARSAQSKPLVDVSKLGQKPPEKFTNPVVLQLPQLPCGGEPGGAACTPLRREGRRRATDRRRCGSPRLGRDLRAAVQLARRLHAGREQVDPPEHQGGLRA